MKYLTKEILDEDEKNVKRDLEHLNQICGHILALCESKYYLEGLYGLKEWEKRRDHSVENLSKIAEARKRLEL